MKKILFVGFILVIQSMYSQVISKDVTFASSGTHYIEVQSEAGARMIQNKDNIKYLLSNYSHPLIIKSPKQTPDITFDNPTSKKLVYKSNKKVAKIEIFTTEGELAKTVKENNSDISELPEGIYIAMVTFENGQVSKKLLSKK